MIAGVGLQKTTEPKAVVPFYAYAALALVAGTLMLFLDAHHISGHPFQPRILAIVHLMTVGWITMVILGASHQLLPVVIEGELDSLPLAYFSFVTTAVGIPFLVYGFYYFRLDWVLLTGGILINLGTLSYLLNVVLSVIKSKKKTVFVAFMMMASIWLFVTTFVGLLLAINFTHFILPGNSVEYLSLHAHLGIIGWFLLLAFGVGSRLIPMFMISKYTNEKLLWWVFSLIHIGLISFIIFQLFGIKSRAIFLSSIPVVLAIIFFAKFCHAAYKARFRRRLDDQMKMSMFAVFQALVPAASLIFLIIFWPATKHTNLMLLYGFVIFFGWLTALILGMTFKTLPFIIWNQVYSKRAKSTQALAPKDMFNEKVFKGMVYLYIFGFVIAAIAIIFSQTVILKIGAFALLLAAILYVTNVGLTIFHKAKEKES